MMTTPGRTPAGKQTSQRAGTGGRRGRRSSLDEVLARDRIAALVLLGVLTLGALVFLPHILDGGRFSDDWAVTADDRFSRPLSTFAGTGRPLAGPYWSLVYPLFGSSSHAVIAKAVVQALLMCVALFLALAELGVARRHAMALTLLVLVFAPADSTRFWPASAHSTVALLCYFMGVVLALRGFRGGRRERIALHAGSLALYVSSVLLYQAAASAILASGLLYRCGTSWRPIRWRWAADLLVVLGAIVLAANAHGYAVVHGIGILTHIARLVAGMLLLASWSVAPVGGYHTITPLRALAGLVALAVLLAGWRRAANPAWPTGDQPVAKWLRLSLAGLAFAAVSYCVLIPAADYTPVARGFGNRINVLAAVGMVCFAYSTWMLAGHMLLANHSRTGATAGVLALLALGVGYAGATLVEEGRWNTARREQQVVLVAIRQGIGRPPPGTRIYSFGAPAFTAPGVPVFHAPWDLQGAVQVMWGDPSLQAVAVAGDTHATCRTAAAVPRGDDPFTPSQQGLYGRVVFIDVRDRHVAWIRGRQDCQRWMTTVHPVPSAPA